MSQSYWVIHLWSCSTCQPFLLQQQSWEFCFFGVFWIFIFTTACWEGKQMLFIFITVWKESQAVWISIETVPNSRCTDQVETKLFCLIAVDLVIAVERGHFSLLSRTSIWHSVLCSLVSVWFIILDSLEAPPFYQFDIYLFITCAPSCICSLSWLSCSLCVSWLWCLSNAELAHQLLSESLKDARSNKYRLLT